MESQPQRWMIWALALAGVSSIGWGAALLSGSGGVPAELSRGTGWLVTVLGVGYLMAASDPFRHWPVVAMGFAAKLGLLVAATAGFGWGERGAFVSAWAVADDVIWLAPFGWVLWAARSAAVDRRRMASPEILRMALSRKTNYGVTLDELSRMSPVLLVFLRHAGCTFCREALADLAAKRREIEASGTRLVLVHMGTEQHGAKFFEKYGLEAVPQISDPRRNLYRAFGLPRGTFGDLFGPKVWVRGFQAAILGRHGVGRLAGDGFQMPGVFLLFHGEVVRSYRHQSAADRPDYMALVTGQTHAPQQVRR